MFGIFGCKSKMEKMKKEYENKISVLEYELSQREKCSTNTLQRLESFEQDIVQLKKNIKRNEHEVREEYKKLED